MHDRFWLMLLAGAAFTSSMSTQDSPAKTTDTVNTLSRSIQRGFVAILCVSGSSAPTVVSCLRLFELAERPGLKLSFNLCHFLRRNDISKLDETLVAAAPHLGLVQINGADRTSESINTKQGKAAWAEFIQPLGEGNFDMAGLLKRLDELGYQGPFAFQTYSLNGPASEYLKQSMDAWKELNRRN